MPIYEYQCSGCGKKHEVVQRHNDKPLSKCPDCGASMTKLISSTSFVLKGTGWYKTDYASAGAKKTAGGDKEKPAKEEKKAEGQSESKPASALQTASKTE
jgi:putative FmdB family regulatory protein